MPGTGLRDPKLTTSITYHVHMALKFYETGLL